MRIECTYLRDTGFKDGQDWPSGVILQFLYASHEVAYAVVLPTHDDRPRLVEICNVRVTQAALSTPYGAER